MNLTKFDSNSSNPNISNSPHPSLNPSQIPLSAIDLNDSVILKNLGEKILENTESLSSLAASKKIDPSRIKNFEHLTHELQSIFSKTSRLMQKSYNDDSSSIHQEIEELEDEVSSLESQLAQSLSGKELDQLLDITRDFHNILQSAESYLAFKERFLAVDEQHSESLELISGPVYGDLHGWSPSAAHGAAESMEQLRTLIKMTVPILEQKGTFTPEILAHLASSIRSGSFACSDWLHGLAAKYAHVLSVAKEQWIEAEKAFEATSSLEDYAKMQLYGKQLQNMQKVFAQLQKLPDSSVFRWMANRLDQQLQKATVDDEYAVKKNMRNDLQLLQASLAEAGRLAKSQANELDKVIKDSHIDEKLAKAEEVIAKKDLKPFIQKIRKEYEGGERSLERYVTAKCQLNSIPKSYEKELAFCHDEEHHFVQELGYAIDFEELVQAEIMKLGQPKPGVFSRLWQAMPDPANWSDTTKRWVHSSLIGLQLGDQILKMLPKSNPVVNVEVSTLSKEDQELLANERSLIGNLLDVKFDVFKKDPSKIDRFSKGKPEVGNFFKALIERYPQAPSSKDSRILLDRYEAYRTEVLLHSESQKTLDWVLETTRIPKAKPINSAPKLLIDTSTKIQDTAQPKMETALSTEQNMKNIREAAREIAVLDRQLQQCSRMEFLKPSLPVSPKALLELREELAILKHSLADSMENKPVEQSTAWNIAVQQQCHDLRDLETRIGVAMSAYEEARAMNNYYNYNSLDVLGNKHKNLVKQAHLTEALGIEGLNVPMPQGIESHKIMAFLKNYAPEVFEHWDQIKAISQAHGKSGILDNNEVISHLKAIDEGIANAFLKAATDDKAFSNLGITQEMKDWLAELAKAGKHLMVRSTGAEDSKKSANAGGNASIAYVKPTREELSQALGEVVRSYFSAGSLQKRLNANLDPFEDELRVAVTTQELIGEPLGGAKEPSETPVSLVLFTSEPLYIGDEKFRAMRISATYGHGEGVVGNRGIASDTALVLISASDPGRLYVLYDNQEKPERLAPVRDPVTKKISLEKIPNSQDIAKTPALNDDLISRLYTWGVIGEKYFEDFTDMEIVVKGGTIYPVQGRPINRGKLFATYLDPKKISDLPGKPIKQTLRTEMIVPGKASVVEITKLEEILIVETLEKAEGLFKKGQHKLVVVGQEEPANSHPVVNFSALGIPCLYAKDLSEIQKLAGQINPSNHLAVCVQAGTISLWDTTKGKVEDFTTEGFVVHPAKIAASLPFKDPLPQKAGIISDAPENVKAALYALRTATNNQDALVQFNALKNDAWIKGLDAKINELEEKVAKQPLFEHAVRPTIEMAKSLRTRIDGAFKEVEALLNQPGEPGRLQFLVHVKALETFLFQRPVSPGAISQKSLLTMQESFAAADAMMVYQSQLEHPAHFADVLMDGTQSPIDTVFDEWSKFLLRLEPIAESAAKGKYVKNESLMDSFLVRIGFKESTQSEISRFKTALHTLRQGGVLPLYMTFFLSSVDLTDPIGAVRAILASMPSTEEPIIEQIFVQRNEIRQLKNDIAHIANPKTYGETLAKLDKAIEDFLPENQDWLKKANWEKTSPVTRSIAIQTMNELVDLFDTAIKTMKASPEIGSDIEKTQKFKEMVGLYLKLMKAWSQDIVGEKSYMQTTKSYMQITLNVYILKIENIFKGLSEVDPRNLRPSSEFSVSAALLGLRPLSEIKFPVTLEDIFTLSHQNLLASTAVLTKELFSENQIQSSPLPQLLKFALESIGKSGDRTLQQIGVNADQRGITFIYNIPLSMHSAKLSIHYDRMLNRIIFEGQLLGVAGQEAVRWPRGKERLEILSFAKVLSLDSEVKQITDELSFKWKIDSQVHLEKAFGEFNAQIKDSYIGSGRISDNQIHSFVTEVTKAKDVSAIANFLLENQNSLHDYGTAVVNLFFEKTQNIDVLSATAFLGLFRSQHQMTELLKSALISQLREVDISNLIKERTTQAQNKIIENVLMRFKNDPNLIYQLPINLVTLDIWKELIFQQKGISEILVKAKTDFVSPNRIVRNLIGRLLIEIARQGHRNLEIIHLLQQALQDQDGVVVVKAAEGLLEFVREGQLIPEIMPLMQQALRDNDSSVRNLAVRGLIEIAKQRRLISEIMPLMQQALQDKNSLVRSSALNGLSEIVNQGQLIPEIMPLMQQALQDKDWDVRNSAVRGLTEIAKQGQLIPEIMPLMQQALQDKNWVVRNTAVTGLTEIVKQGQLIPEIMPLMQQALQDEDLNVRYLAVEGLTEIVKQGQLIREIMPLMQQALRDEDWNLRGLAVEGLTKIAKQGQLIREIMPLMQQALQDKVHIVRNTAKQLQDIINKLEK